MKKILLLLFSVLTIFSAYADTVTIKATEFKGMKAGVSKIVDGFEFTAGASPNIKGVNVPNTSKGTYIGLNKGCYLRINRADAIIKSITISWSYGDINKLYVNDDSIQYEQLKTNVHKWTAVGEKVSELMFTYCYKSSSKTYKDNAKQFRISELTIEYEQKADAKEASLQEMLKGGEAGSYKITGKNLVGVKWLTDNETQATYALVKDDNGCAMDAVVPSGRSYDIDGHQQSAYDQSNWLLVKTAKPIVEGQCIKSITGQLQSAAEHEFAADNVELENGTESFAPNVYCPTNLMGVPQQTGADNATYFFMTPKPCEYAKIVYAVYAGDNKFYAPKKVGESVNRLGFAGGFDVSWRFNEEATEPNLTVGGAYEFNAIILSKTQAADAASRLFDTDTSLGTSDKFVVCPLNLNSNTTPTAVVAVESDSVASTTYYNVMGVASSVPHNGVNLMVQKMTDGTTKVTKMQHLH